MSVYDLDWAEGRAEANDLYLGMDWPDPPEGDDDEPEDDEGRRGVVTDIALPNRPQSHDAAFEPYAERFSKAGRRVPVMVRGGRVRTPSKYRIHGAYETFEEAAVVVQELRNDPSVAWAYIPDKYAELAPKGVVR